MLLHKTVQFYDAKLCHRHNLSVRCSRVRRTAGWHLPLFAQMQRVATFRWHKSPKFEKILVCSRELVEFFDKLKELSHGKSETAPISFR